MFDDSQYYPTWLSDQGWDLDTVTKEIMQIPVAPRDGLHMKYRGHELKRSKFFLVDDLDQVPIYSYPGFQYEAVVKEYKLISDFPIIQEIKNRLCEEFKVNLNHVIGTVYYNKDDNIERHNDKVQTLDPNTPIFTVSLLSSRPLAVRPNPKDAKDKPKVSEVMLDPGSFLVVGPKTNSNYQHAILPQKQKLDTKISLIFRCASNRLPMEDVAKKAAATQKRRKPQV